MYCQTIQAHASIYFDTPDGNAIELITPLRLDFAEDFKMMPFHNVILCITRVDAKG